MRTLKVFLPILLVTLVSIASGQTITIDRSKPLNPAKFIGKGWTIEEQDERSLSLTTIDLSKVRFETCLKDGEVNIDGEEKLKRLKEAADYIRLDAKVMQTLLSNKKLIPESWKQKNGEPLYIFFDGTIFKDSDGVRYIVGMAFLNKKWDWDFIDLSTQWTVQHPSAVITIEHW